MLRTYTEYRGIPISCQGDSPLEFSEFSKQEVRNLPMFYDSFESFDWTLISLRSLLLAVGGQVGTGCCPNPFRPLVSNSFPGYFTRKWERKL